MDNRLINLKILLPFRVFLDIQNVSEVVLETSEGSYGLLPQRLDCVAALVAGIFSYEIDKQGVQYVAIDNGILVKAGRDVLVSVRNAIGGADLGKLADLVKDEFRSHEELETEAKTVVAKLESGFIYSFDKLRSN